MKKYGLFNVQTEINDIKYRKMIRFPLHEFSWFEALNNTDPVSFAVFESEEDTLKELGKYKNTAHKKGVVDYDHWEFDLFFVEELEVDEDGDLEPNAESGIWQAEWEHPEWEQNEYCNYSYYYRDSEDEE